MNQATDSPVIDWSIFVSYDEVSGEWVMTCPNLPSVKAAVSRDRDFAKSLMVNRFAEHLNEAARSGKGHGVLPDDRINGPPPGVARLRMHSQTKGGL